VITITAPSDQHRPPAKTGMSSNSAWWSGCARQLGSWMHYFYIVNLV
jgi:hypothetical protein